MDIALGDSMTGSGLSKDCKLWILCCRGVLGIADGVLFGTGGFAALICNQRQARWTMSLGPPTQKAYRHCTQPALKYSRLEFAAFGSFCAWGVCVITTATQLG